MSEGREIRPVVLNPGNSPRVMEALESLRQRSGPAYSRMTILTAGFDHLTWAMVAYQVPPVLRLRVREFVAVLISDLAEARGISEDDMMKVMADAAMLNKLARDDAGDLLNRERREGGAG